MDEKGITNIDSKVEKNSIRTYTHKIKRPLRDIVGREKEMDIKYDSHKCDPRSTATGILFFVLGFVFWERKKA